MIRFRPFVIVGALVLLVVVVALVVTGMTGTGSGASGRIVANHTSHEFGTVPINGGLIDAKFALTTDQSTIVKRIEST